MIGGIQWLAASSWQNSHAISFLKCDVSDNFPLFIFKNEISLSQNVQTLIYSILDFQSFSSTLAIFHLLKVFLPSMRTWTGSPLFSDFRSDLSRAVRFPTAGQGNDDTGNEIVCKIKKSKNFKKISNIALGEEWMGKILKTSLGFYFRRNRRFVIWGKFMQIHVVSDYFI